MDPSRDDPSPTSLLKHLRHAWRDFRDERQPLRIGWPQVFGSVLLFLVALQALTGFLMALVYSPSTESAYESVRYIQHRALFGGLIRGMHRWGANLLIVTLAIHIAQVFLWGAYKRPRQWTWVAGCLLLLIMLGFGFTGYLLPWDLKAYFGTQVGTNIAGSAPVLGPYILTLLRGGPQLGPLTLPRFYAIHVLLLPALLLIGLAWHLWQVRNYGITAPWSRVGEEQNVPREKPFFPFQAARDSTAVLVAFLLLMTLAILQSRGVFGPPLEAKADPTNSTFVPRPDWYFLGLQHLLRLFPSGFGQVLATTVIPTMAVALLLALPFLDRNPERFPRRRPIAMTAGALAALAVVSLTLAGERAVRVEEQALARRLAAARSTPTRAAAVPTERPPQNEAKLIASGALLFDQLKCASCHAVTGPPRDGIPTLAWEGSRARRNWLRVYLKKPTRIHWETDLSKPGQRPERRMPNFDLTDPEVERLTAFLMNKVDPKLIPPQPGLDTPADPDALARGQAIVHKTYNCTLCHRIGSEGNPFGPDLTHVGSGRKPDFIYAIIANPYRLDSQTAMKNLHLAPVEIQDAVRYLSSLR